ncbi:MAG: hypothetical protein F6K45_08720 [Kamptonema sp. SIO1D9]|nr:hypothetical protein [Kamptonema sp. SIO1D9]
MANVIRESDDNLPVVDYTDILQKIITYLRQQNLFKISGDRQRLLIKLDTIAANLSRQSIQNPLNSTRGVRSATVNFNQNFANSFPQLIQQIRDILRESLCTTLNTDNIAEFIGANLITNLEQFQGNSQQLGLIYNFNRQFTNLQKQKLSIDKNRFGGESLLKFHKVTISVQHINSFQSELQAGVENYIDNEVTCSSETEREELHEILEEEVENNESEFHKLQRIVDQETLGKLKKEAKITYLTYIIDNIGSVDATALIYLQTLRRRLRLIEYYITHQDKAYADYDVYYAGATVNYRDVFARAEAVDSLPIVPIIAGILGENTDRERGETQFIFGLKFKFNNPVQNQGGKSVFDYNLDILNPDSEEHQRELRDRYNREKFARKVLRRVFLYYFVFTCDDPQQEGYHPRNDLNYDPIHDFERKILPTFKSDNQEEKEALLRGIITGFKEYNVQGKIAILRKALQNFIHRDRILPTGNYSRQIVVRKSVLKKDINSNLDGNFFEDVVVSNPKQCLKYILIQNAGVETDALCQLPVNIEIEDIRYYLNQESQQFSWQYNIKEIPTLPILWIPRTKNNPCWNLYERHFQQHKHIIFSYNNTHLISDNITSEEAFIYHFSWSLLAYICISILLEKAPKNLFLPMVRLHEGTHKKPFPVEKFLANLSKIISYLLSEKYLSSSQGFRINNIDRFKINNGLNSLYSRLPKHFSFENIEPPQLDKLAIIVVASRETDAWYDSRRRRDRCSNMTGEVVSISSLDNGTIRIETVKTFSDNYHVRRLYRNPPILIDRISNLYRQGYRHFLYIAKAPYTSSLHITQTDVDEGLYFMSPSLIKELKGERDDIKIYPVFFDKYYVHKLKNFKSKSLYIQDTRQLMKVARDTKQQAIVFFNLFNGIEVGPKTDRFYNGVISYSTLLKIHSDVIDDNDIMRGLIDDNSLKNDILKYLTLFHFSRFEKTSQISLKLDPYENIIGDESFGALSVFPQMTETVEFNSLAFLTEVSKALMLD